MKKSVKLTESILSDLENLQKNYNAELKRQMIFTVGYMFGLKLLEDYQFQFIMSILTNIKAIQ